MRTLYTAFPALLVLLGALGCEQGRPSGSAVPPEGFTGDAVTGKAKYQRLCARCHGDNAGGSNHGPPLIHKIYEPNHHGDMAFYLAARNGVRAHHWKFGDMPEIPTATPEDVGHVIAYIRREQKRAGIY